jgi:hypothetical protein
MDIERWLVEKGEESDKRWITRQANLAAFMTPRRIVIAAINSLIVGY